MLNATLCCLPTKQCSQGLRTVPFTSGNSCFLPSICIPFSLMWPNRLCHNSVCASLSAILTLPLLNFASIVYKVVSFDPLATPKEPLESFHFPPPNLLWYPTSSR